MLTLLKGASKAGFPVTEAFKNWDCYFQTEDVAGSISAESIYSQHIFHLCIQQLNEKRLHFTQTAIVVHTMNNEVQRESKISCENPSHSTAKLADSAKFTVQQCCVNNKRFILINEKPWLWNAYDKGPQNKKIPGLHQWYGDFDIICVLVFVGDLVYMQNDVSYSSSIVWTCTDV